MMGSTTVSWVEEIRAKCVVRMDGANKGSRGRRFRNLVGYCFWVGQLLVGDLG